jgi:hypothetical protein
MQEIGIDLRHTGFTIEEFNEKLEKQEFRCAISV